MLRFSLSAVLAAGVIFLTACSSSPKPPPEPNKSRMVPVNVTYPAAILKGATE